MEWSPPCTSLENSLPNTRSSIKSEGYVRPLLQPNGLVNLRMKRWIFLCVSTGMYRSGSHTWVDFVWSADVNRLTLHWNLCPANSEACNHAFDEHGIGADLRDILTRPIVADLLITMASAACKCISRRDSLFQHLPSASCFPTNNYVLEHSGKETRVNRVTRVSAPINWAHVISAFSATPSIATMAAKSLQACARDMSLIRSVLNSCRGHLMELQGVEQFPLMATEYQFWLCTDSPSKGSSICTTQTMSWQSVLVSWLTVLQLALHTAWGSEEFEWKQSYVHWGRFWWGHLSCRGQQRFSRVLSLQRSWCCPSIPLQLIWGSSTVHCSLWGHQYIWRRDRSRISRYSCCARCWQCHSQISHCIL